VTRLKAEGYPYLLLLDKAGHVRLEHVGELMGRQTRACPE
jgi:hypothetical protein